MEAISGDLEYIGKVRIQGLVVSVKMITTKGSGLYELHIGDQTEATKAILKLWGDKYAGDPERLLGAWVQIHAEPSARTWQGKSYPETVVTQLKVIREALVIEEKPEIAQDASIQDAECDEIPF